MVVVAAFEDVVGIAEVVVATWGVVCVVVNVVDVDVIEANVDVGAVVDDIVVVI